MVVMDNFYLGEGVPRVIGNKWLQKESGAAGRDPSSGVVGWNIKDTGWIDRIWVFNFPDGMSGINEYVGRYYKACRYAVSENNYPGPCEDPNELIVVLGLVLIVNFYLIESEGFY